MHKQNKSYTSDGMLFSLKKGRNADIYHSVNEPYKHYAE